MAWEGDYDTFEEWVEEFKPVTNPDGSPRFFDDYYQADRDFMRDITEPYIWSNIVAEGEDFLRSGLHYCDCMGFYVATVPYTKNDVLVHIAYSSDRESVDEEEEEEEK